MTEKERDVVVPLIMRGFKDCALEAGTTVTGGQTVMNPWCTIGGVATTICQVTLTTTILTLVTTLTFTQL